MERNVNCRSVPCAELKWLICCASCTTAKKKKKNLMPNLHLQNVLMRNWEFFLFGLISLEENRLLLILQLPLTTMSCKIKNINLVFK